MSSVWEAIAVRTRSLMWLRSPLLMPPKTDMTSLCASVVRVDGAADFRYPQLDAVVGEQGHGEAELVAVEGAVRFADDDCGRIPDSGHAARRAGDWRVVGAAMAVKGSEPFSS